MENVSPPLIIVFFLIGLILALLFRSRLKSRRSKPNAPSPQSETLNGQSITPVWETASLLNISSKMSADLEEVADRTDEVLSKAITQVGYDDDVMFGDSGECTFFITEADLKARRFDRVLYNWDCC